eukprot:1761981-Pyramimonas_sp.AAC.1
MGTRGRGIYSYQDHGFVPRHRREEAITIQNITSHALNNMGWLHITNAHDLANAFSSSAWPAMSSA